MFDAFSVCHLLSQTVMDVTLFTFWLVIQKYSSLQKIEKNTVYIHYFLAHLLFLNFLGGMSSLLRTEIEL